MPTPGLGYDSRAVANKILDIARSKSRNLTIMQLVKLIYFAQGWDLAFTDRPITFHKAQAWQYGPVYPLVYKAFPLAGSQPLEGQILQKGDGKPYSAEFSDDDTQLLDWVTDKYAKVHAFDLSQLTHAEGGPWQTAIATGGLYSEIPDSSMRSYFKQFVGDGAKA